MRILWVVALFLTCNLYAQQHPVGIKIGGNLANLSGDGTSDLSTLLNFHAGFFMEIDLTKDIKIQPELLFTVYGFKLDEGDDPSVRLNYVALPVIAKYVLSEKFSLDAGPQVGLLVTAKNGTGSLADVKTDFFDRDFGVNFGISYEFSDKLSTSLRYYMGITDVTKVQAKNYNRAFQLAFQFKIK
ncbi:porin family protein [Winogradskyella aquimaris]|uniref:Porin family protein n=1 Tax=Winogradskyella aquimaris TaxID=864074 RepID=A0ABU5EMZ3_9FLAO|nr:porin family protein [Winogradskyella aquimaris]MDY2587603.1 porin family protein [Winogradskyella aquimaris]